MPLRVGWPGKIGFLKIVTGLGRLLVRWALQAIDVLRVNFTGDIGLRST